MECRRAGWLIGLLVGLVGCAGGTPRGTDFAQPGAATHGTAATGAQDSICCPVSTFWVRWTHPSLNADSTSLSDLGWMRFFATRGTTGDTLFTDWINIHQIEVNDTLRTIHNEGVYDSIRFTVPPSRQRWTIQHQSADTLFNESEYSNKILRP